MLTSEKVNYSDLKELKRALDLLEENFDNFSFRIINPAEVENLTPDALGYLLSLRYNFSITEDAFEQILVDVSSIFGILDLECLKDLLDYRGIGLKKIIN